jgi:hypothetical protein
MTMPDVRAHEAAEDHIAKQDREIEAKEEIIRLQADEIARKDAEIVALKGRLGDGQGESLVERWPYTGHSFPGRTAPVIY